MMKYTDIQIEELRHRVEERMSKKRFLHSLGVEKMAAYIGQRVLPESVSELRAAALLHDISKEYSEAEYFLTIKKHNLTLTEEDLATPPLWHSITAPGVVADEFSEYADEDVLSAVYNHTVGSPDMSVFDEIILLSDYIEEGRQYKACIDLREKFLADLAATDASDEAVLALHRAVAESLTNNINEFVSRGKSFHKRTGETRDAILAKTERQNNGKY